MKRKQPKLSMKPNSKNINILSPNINYSHWFYKATTKGIYLSIGAIKGVGYQSVKLIVDERHANGQFKDFLILQEEFQSESRQESYSKH